MFFVIILMSSGTTSGVTGSPVKPALKSTWLYFINPSIK